VSTTLRLLSARLLLVLLAAALAAVALVGALSSAGSAHHGTITVGDAFQSGGKMHLSSKEWN